MTAVRPRPDPTFTRPSRRVLAGVTAWVSALRLFLVYPLYRAQHVVSLQLIDVVSLHLAGGTLLGVLGRAHQLEDADGSGRANALQRRVGQG